MIILHSKFGRYKGKNGVWLDQSGQKRAPASVGAPQKVINDQHELCPGCPYPRHGLSCYDRESGGCLRQDMIRISRRSCRVK